MVTVEQLYSLCEKLDMAKENIAKNAEDYIKIISATKGGANEKKLASQLIVRFYHRLPEQRVRALDALFVLCEDDDVNIRKLVIKELPTLCKDGYHVDKVADVLTQLLQTDNSHEQILVQTALLSLLNAYPSETLKMVFGQIMQTEEDLIRERAIHFLATKLRSLPSTVMTKEIEDLVVAEAKKVMADVTCEEFLLFMHILQGLPHLQTLAGRKQLLQLILDQADIEKPFPINDADRIDQVIHCLKQASPYLSKNVPSNKMVVYLIDSALPNLAAIRRVVEGSDLEILRVLAELCHFVSSLPDLKEKLTPIIKMLIDTMPIPPSEQNGSSTSSNNGDDDHSQVKFSEIEALLYVLHQLGKHDSSTVAAILSTEENKELRKRMQYLARLLQVYSSKLKLTLSKIAKKDADNEENKLKFVALRTTNNISSLTRDMLLQPPQFKTTITMSWKPVGSPQKRKADESTPIASAPKEKGARREERSVYAPPSGKFSEKAGTFKESDGDWNSIGVGGGRGGGGGGRGGGGRGGGSMRGRGGRGGRRRRGY